MGLKNGGNRLRLGAVILVAFLTALAFPAALAVDTSVSVGNAPPSVLSALLEPIVYPTAAGSTSVPLSATVSDPNGHADLVTVAAHLTPPGGGTGRTVELARAAASGTQATFTGTFPMAYHDAPGTWTVRVMATDAARATGHLDLTFAFARLAALGLNADALEFGQELFPGQLSDVAPLAVINRGNVEMDLLIISSALRNATTNAVISERNVRWSFSSDMAGFEVLSDLTEMPGFNLVPGASSSRTIHWQVQIPAGSEQWIPAGTYRGTLVLGAQDGGL